MLLDDILQGDQAYIYMERYLDEGTKTYSPFAASSEAEPQYQPRGSTKSFNLIDVVVPKSIVSIFLAQPQKEIQDFYINDKEVHFLVHPETWNNKDVKGIELIHNFLLGSEIEVAPTASTRTVLITKALKNVPSHFIKLHYPKICYRRNYDSCS